MLYKKINNSSLTNRWVIGDIHGCKLTLQVLLNQLDLKITD
jgi:hypothetical protein